VIGCRWAWVPRKRYGGFTGRLKLLICVKNLFFGVDAEEAFNSVSLREKVIEKTRPWLGNFWKGQKEKVRAWYQSDEYLDLAVQTWRVEQDGMPKPVYTVCGTRLQRSSGEDGAGAGNGL
jgi:hypothetical protein